jgi:hypothetical protein
VEGPYGRRRSTGDVGEGNGKGEKPMPTKDEIKERLAIPDCEPLKIKLLGKRRLR